MTDITSGGVGELKKAKEKIGAASKPGAIVSYDTHWNGGRPFSVSIKQSDWQVSNSDKFSPNIQYDVVVYRNEYQKVKTLHHVIKKEGRREAVDCSGEKSTLPSLPSIEVLLSREKSLLCADDKNTLPSIETILATAEDHEKPDAATKNVVTYQRVQFELMNLKNVEVFVGKCPIAKPSRYSTDFGADLDGNSILIQTDSEIHRYLFVGDNIFAFTALAPIIKFSSPMGRSDCPYPCAVDSDLNHYLMISKVVLTKVKDHASYIANPDLFDAYSYYFGYEGGPGYAIKSIAVYIPGLCNQTLTENTNLEIVQTSSGWRYAYDESFDPHDDITCLTYDPDFSRYNSKYTYVYHDWESSSEMKPQFDENGKLPNPLTKADVRAAVDRFAEECGYVKFTSLTVKHKGR